LDLRVYSPHWTCEYTHCIGLACILTEQTRLCYGSHAYNTQAAYNNTSEIELEDADILLTQTSGLSLYPVGTKVAKQFDGADGQLVWFEGVVQRFDEELYWVLYSDGDSEDMDTDEVRDAVQNYKLHLQPEEIVAEAEFDAANSSPPDTRADIDDTTLVVVVNDQAPAEVNSAPISNTDSSSSSELAVAMQAMTAAAEQLAAAATRIEAAVQTQRVQQRPQQLQHPQQIMLRQYWQQAMLQQQQQQRLAYYQQQQMLYWQQM
jgi:hypothetical protein